MTSLFNKLLLKEQEELLVLGAPESFDAELTALEDGIVVKRDAAQVESVRAVLAFVTTQAEITAAADAILPKADEDPLIWFAYPKITSKRYRCEFDRDTAWSGVRKAGFENTRQVALDGDWSILRFRRAEHMARTYDAAKLTELRVQRGWSQGELARRASVIQNYISKLENSRIEWPSMYHLQKIANALEVPLSALTSSSDPDASGAAKGSDIESLRSEPPPRLKVFICHASSDKPAARELYRRLKLDGFEPWLDEEDLLPGQYWRKEIAKAVSQAHLVVVCLSSTSVTRQGFVQKEISYALDIASEQPEDTIFVIPVRLEDCAVPSRLSEWQWVNLFDPRGYEFLLRALRHRAESL
jgi:transcriptional regulator with XRE-family HTH domain